MDSKIFKVWQRFDSFPMETITKAWFLKHSENHRQRTVEEMRDHRAKHGASGNCFDLSIWLSDELKNEKIESYFIGNNLGTSKAHVALIALGSNGERYLCDLGDLWIRPILIDDPIKHAEGFFTGAYVTLSSLGDNLDVKFERSNGKQSHQKYDLKPIPNKTFIEAGDFSQQNLSDPLIEMRLFQPDETVHWEFDGERSFISSMKGLFDEPVLASFSDWSNRISSMTGMNATYVKECLLAYQELKDK